MRLKRGCKKDLCCHLFFFAVVVDVVTELTREGALRVFLYANDLVLMSERIDGLSNKLIMWKEAFESKV